MAFFLEIFEFNFCNLNKNTKRNINKRAVEEGLLKDSDRSSSASDILVDISGGYKLDGEKNISGRNSEKEMYSINDEYSDFERFEN